jgi:hypothetical protein
MNTGLMSTNVGGDIGEDPFEVLRPAQPTLDAVVRMRTPLLWLKRPPLDVKRASQHRMEAIRRCELIPMDRELYRADRLFEQAETEPAPEWWMHTVLGVWLGSRPTAANIREAFRCGIVDSMYRDPEVGEMITCRASRLRSLPRPFARTAGRTLAPHHRLAASLRCVPSIASSFDAGAPT